VELAGQVLPPLKLLMGDFFGLVPKKVPLESSGVWGPAFGVKDAAGRGIAGRADGTMLCDSRSG
jgi:hypothetical protein